MATIITIVVNTDQDAQYVKDVLGHGGCNIFPTYEAKCPGCETVYLSTNTGIGLTICSVCGVPTKMIKQGESFSEWSYKKPDSSLSCEFIDRAARKRG